MIIASKFGDISGVNKRFPIKYNRISVHIRYVYRGHDVKDNHVLLVLSKKFKNIFFFNGLSFFTLTKLLELRIFLQYK